MRRWRWASAAGIAVLVLAACKDEVLIVVPVASVDLCYGDPWFSCNVLRQGGAVVVQIGQPLPVRAIPHDDRGNELSLRRATWMSSNPSAVSVTRTGELSAVVTATTTARAVITATIGAIQARDSVTSEPPIAAVQRRSDFGGS